MAPSEGAPSQCQVGDRRCSEHYLSAKQGRKRCSTISVQQGATVENVQRALSKQGREGALSQTSKAPKWRVKALVQCEAGERRCSNISVQPGGTVEKVRQSRRQKVQYLSAASHLLG